MIPIKQHLRAAAVPRELLDTFLESALGSWTISTQLNGARTARMYAERPCRINTYGDSFTECHQVSDGEAWQKYLAGHVGPSSIEWAPVNALAEWLGVAGIRGTDTGGPENDAARIRTAYGIAATRHVIDMVDRFCREHGRHLLILLQCPVATMQILRGEPRYDQDIVDSIREKGIRYFDMNVAHGQDFRSFNLTAEAYRKRYHIGHDNPRGNHLFAYALKDTLIDMLDPRPRTYRGEGGEAVDATRSIRGEP